MRRKSGPCNYWSAISIKTGKWSSVIFTINACRLGVQVLSYCLMSNHHHPLVKTPEANLGRVRRPTNGVYTQRYNRRNKPDGSLFSGRYFGLQELAVFQMP